MGAATSGLLLGTVELFRRRALKRDQAKPYEDEYETLDPTKGGSVVPPKSE